MKFNKITKWLPAAAMLVALGVSSCTNDLDVTPIDPNTQSDFHQNEVFTKIYSTLALTGSEGPAGMGDVDGIDEGQSAFYRLVWNAQELPTDEMKCNWGDPGIPEFNTNTWNATTSFVEGLYYRLYFDVTLCNFFLAQIQGQDDATSVAQRAEARFMRALNYYYLMDMFGSVAFPLELSASNPDPITRADLYNWLIEELVGTEGCVNDMVEPGTATYGRADKAAAWLLASRLYLNAEVYTGTADWTNAATYAKKVMDSSYSLAPEYRNLFVADNNENGAQVEVLLAIMQDGIDTKSYGGSTFLIASTHKGDMGNYGITGAWAGNRATANMMQKFFPNDNAPNVDEADMVAAANDKRALFFGIDRELYIADKTTEFVAGYSSTKFNNLRADGAASKDSGFADTDIPFLRAAEAYLTFAEANARMNGGTTNGEGTAAIDALRTRANASTQAVYDLDFILDEWSREFSFEGRRRIDLIRHGKFGGVNNYTWEWKGGVQTGTSFSSHLNIFPIPGKDLNNNDKLSQNPGY